MKHWWLNLISGLFWVNLILDSKHFIGKISALDIEIVRVLYNPIHEIMRNWLSLSVQPETFTMTKNKWNAPGDSVYVYKISLCQNL